MPFCIVLDGADYPHSLTLIVTVHLSDGKRRSIKMKSQQTFNEGLFVIDTNRIPWGCGVWPAFWTTREEHPEWPAYGEIDIIEQVHNSTFTQHTLHTRYGCDYTSVDTTGQFTGTWAGSKDCNKDNALTGCGIQAAEGTHGKPWKTGGGGITVMLWDREKGTLSSILINP